MSYLMTSNDFPQSTENRKIMILKICSFSEKLKNHLISCETGSCDICIKTRLCADIFIKYEKDNNKTINLQEIMDENFVDDVLFSDKLMFVTTLINGIR